MNKVIIQITSGKGPAECCRVVFHIREIMLKQAAKQGVSILEIGSKKADKEGTLLSVTLSAQGHKLEEFIQEWKGTVQWIAHSYITNQSLICHRL